MRCVTVLTNAQLSPMFVVNIPFL